MKKERERKRMFIQSGVTKRKKGETRRGRAYVNVRSDRRRRRGYISLASVGWEGYIRPGQERRYRLDRRYTRVNRHEFRRAPPREEGTMEESVVPRERR